MISMLTKFVMQCVSGFFKRTARAAASVDRPSGGLDANDATPKRSVYDVVYTTSAPTAPPSNAPPASGPFTM